MASAVGPGEYTILNKVQASDGSRLAVTFNQRGSPLPVLKPNGEIFQTWIVRGNPGELQTISPAGHINLEVEPVNNDYVVPNQAHSSWWIVGQGFNGLVIYTEDRKEVWGLSDAVVGVPVILGSFDTGNERQKWDFIPVDAA